MGRGIMGPLPYQFWCEDRRSYGTNGANLGGKIHGRGIPRRIIVGEGAVDSTALYPSGVRTSKAGETTDVASHQGIGGCN